MRSPISSHRFLLLIFLAVLVRPSQSQQFLIKLVKERSGKQAPHLLLVLVDATTRHPIAVREAADAYTAEAEGVEAIQIAWIGHAPKHHWSDFVTSESCRYGSLGSITKVSEIVTSGVTIGDWCGERRLAPKPAKPGELVIYIRRVHWWEKID